MSARFLCTGDLHLGAGTDLGREPGDRLRDQEATWRRILDLADGHDVDAILFAGDAFHRRRPTPAENMAFQTPLRNRGTFEVLCVPGNHDTESADLPSALDLFDGEHLDVHREPGVWLAPGGVSVVTLPWTPVGRLVAAQGGGDRAEIHRQAADYLIKVARWRRAEIDGPAVLMLHYTVAGGLTPTGLPTDSISDVVLPLAELADLGYQAVVCAHIHLPLILHGGFEGKSGPIFQVGSPDTVDYGEQDSQHGVWILDVPDEGPAELEFIPIAGRRFVTLFADFTDGDDFSMLLEGYGDWTGLDGAVVRVRYRCAEDQVHLIDRDRITRAILDQGAHKVYAFEPTIIRASRARLELIDDQSLSPLSAVELWAEAQSLSSFERDSLMALTEAYLKAVA